MKFRALDFNYQAEASWLWHHPPDDDGVLKERKRSVLTLHVVPRPALDDKAEKEEPAETFLSSTAQGTDASNATTSQPSLSIGSFLPSNLALLEGPWMDQSEPSWFLSSDGHTGLDSPLQPSDTGTSQRLSSTWQETLQLVWNGLKHLAREWHARSITALVPHAYMNQTTSLVWHPRLLVRFFRLLRRQLQEFVDAVVILQQVVQLMDLAMGIATRTKRSAASMMESPETPAPMASVGDALSITLTTDDENVARPSKRHRPSQEKEDSSVRDSGHKNDKRLESTAYPNTDHDSSSLEQASAAPGDDNEPAERPQPTSLLSDSKDELDKDISVPEEKDSHTADPRPDSSGNFPNDETQEELQQPESQDELDQDVSVPEEKGPPMADSLFLPTTADSSHVGGGDIPNDETEQKLQRKPPPSNPYPFDPLFDPLPASSNTTKQSRDDSSSLSRQRWVRQSLQLEEEDDETTEPADNRTVHHRRRKRERSLLQENSSTTAASKQEKRARRKKDKKKKKKSKDKKRSRSNGDGDNNKENSKSRKKRKKKEKAVLAAATSNLEASDQQASGLCLPPPLGNANDKSTEPAPNDSEPKQPSPPSPSQEDQKMPAVDNTTNTAGRHGGGGVFDLDKTRDTLKRTAQQSRHRLSTSASVYSSSSRLPASRFQKTQGIPRAMVPTEFVAFGGGGGGTAANSFPTNSTRKHRRPSLPPQQQKAAASRPHPHGMHGAPTHNQQLTMSQPPVSEPLVQNPSWTLPSGQNPTARTESSRLGVTANSNQQPPPGRSTNPSYPEQYPRERFGAATHIAPQSGRPIQVHPQQPQQQQQQSTMSSLDAAVEEPAVGDCDFQNLPPMHVLCSESFLETFGPVVTDLASGEWSNSILPDGTGPCDKLLGRKIQLIDTPLVDECGVDIELPGRSAAVVFPVSDMSNATLSRDFVLGLVQQSAIGRYQRIFVLLNYDVPITAAIARSLLKLQTAVMNTPSTTVSFLFGTPASLSSLVAETCLRAYQRSPRSNMLPEPSAEILSDELFRERAMFLRSLVPTFSGNGAIQCLLLAQHLAPRGPSFNLLLKSPRMRQDIMLAATSKDSSAPEIHPLSMVQLHHIIHAPIPFD